MPRDAKQVSAALMKKGFVPDEGDHTYYRLFVGGKNTGIRTKISHGEKEIHDGLLAQMARQTKLVRRDFLKLVDCPLSEAEYLELLQENGHLPKPEA
ncbi:MAG: type II toxin-antitoxin system HicA family toxin [Lacipirellulaceae bacterium]